MDYNDYNDYELLNYVAEGNEEANNIILKKYEPLINAIALKMLKYCNNSGLEKSDLVQEGLIGLNHALNFFSEQKNTTFYTYAKTCIERKMISAVISSNRLKHKILNDSLSYDDEDSFFERIFKDDTTNPELIITDLDMEEELLTKIKENLTDLESQVFELMLSSFSYKEIADILDKDVKSVDNTIQRIKTKVKKILEEYK